VLELDPVIAPAVTLDHRETADTLAEVAVASPG